MQDRLAMDSLLVAASMFGGFLIITFVASRWLPGKEYAGVRLSDGTQRRYKLNGLRIFALVWLLVAGGVAVGWLSLLPVARHFWALFAVVNLFAFATTALLYVLGRRSPDAPVRSGVIGVAQDLFYGIELNPTWFGVDLKMFSYRPSLIGLSLINASFAALQFNRYGVVSQPMILFQGFTWIYLANYFHYEYGMLHTWDIIAERFGWMLVWGDYVLVPFFYSVAGWFLVERLEPMPWHTVTALCTVYVIGFWLFRGANQQKHRYKSDPTSKIWGRPAQAIGGRLLVSGFWGIGRHLNYTGEILIYLCWTFPVGKSSVIPWLLPCWLISLLVHRAWRDDRRCRSKYGPLWEEYCRRARFRMIPFVY